MGGLTGYLTASTKRSAWSSGKRGEPVENLTGLSCTHLDAVDSRRHGELQRILQFETPHRLLETFVDGVQDIEAGDRFEVSGDDTSYVVRGVAPWAKRGSLPAYTHVILEAQSTEA